MTAALISLKHFDNCVVFSKCCISVIWGKFGAKTNNCLQNYVSLLHFMAIKNFSSSLSSG